MAEYIEREKALSAQNKAMNLSEMRERLKRIPAADVRPVVRGKWQSWEQDKPPCKWYSCDYCGFHALIESNYCPNCGADMRGDQDV